MKGPLFGGATWLDLEETPSTQDVASAHLGENVGVVFARHQTAGRGRFARAWHSNPDDSLTCSLVFHAYPDHPRAYLLGMGVAIAAAGALHLQLQWPNDLVVREKKVGGILTEFVKRPDGKRVAIVGLGINLNQTAFPDEIAHRATSLGLEFEHPFNARAVLQSILDRIAMLPEPESWTDLAPAWSLFDRTPGKKYQLHDGTTAIALGVGPEGQLMCSIDGESHQVLAADAIFGEN